MIYLNIDLVNNLLNAQIKRTKTHLLILILGHRQSRFLFGTSSPTGDFRWLAATSDGLVDLNTVCTCRLKRTSSRGTYCCCCCFNPPPPEDVVRPVTFAMMADGERRVERSKKKNVGYFQPENFTREL